MSGKEGAQRPLYRRRSSMSFRPDMSDEMIIVLLGKSVSENSQVGNFILGREAFDREALPAVVERVGVRLKDRYVTLINSPQLLQTNISDLQIEQTVSECVHLSNPGPHVIVLILEHDQCSAEERKHVEKVLHCLSGQVYQHTMVLNTQEPTKTNEILLEIIQKCSNRHFSLQRNSSRDDLLQVLEDIVGMNDGHHLVCAQYEDSPFFSTEQQDTERCSPESENEVRIVLLGKTGVGKSASGNTILGQDTFKVELSQELVTKECQREICKINGQNVTVIDTPGLFDTKLTNEEIQREISNCISMILPGPHVFIIVINIGQRFTQEEEKTVKIIQETFGENSLRFTMVLFTRADELNKTIEQCLGEPESPLMKLIEGCGNRYHVFNNKQTGDRTQVSDLLNKIDAMVKANGGTFYSCKMFRQMEKEKQEQEMKSLIEKVKEREGKINKLDNERERDTFIHLIENMRQEMENLQIKHKTEIENMKLEENTRREEDDEKRKDEFERRMIEEREKMERAAKDLQSKHEAEEIKIKIHIEKLETENEELLMKLKEMQERMKMMMEEEPQNYDEERKRREEELREKGEWFKRDIEEQEEKERETHETMKRDRDKLQKEKQEEIMRREDSSVLEVKIIEKERIEREQQKQIEDLKKKLEDERSMRNNEQKSFEEQFKLLKEQFKDELQRKQKEWIEDYEREKEKEKKICSKTDDSLQEKIKQLFGRLHLDIHHNKLTPEDVLQINEHLLESCTEKELIQTFLQNLMIMSYRARNLSVRNPSKTDQRRLRDHDSSEEKGTSQSDSIHPMDVQMAVFNRSDGFLKQLMVTKLSQCQFALPMLVPDPFTQGIEFPFWTFRQINKSWKIRNTNNEIISQTQPMYKAQTPMVCFFRFGSVSSSKSQLMNSLINDKHDTFFHRNSPGSSKNRVLMDGVVEIAWYCPSGTDEDKFTDCVAFCNLHGDAEAYEKQLDILTEMASVNVVLQPQLDRKMLSKETKFGKLYWDPKPLICLFPTDVSTVIERSEGKYTIGMKGRSLSDVSKNLRRVINDCLTKTSSTFQLKDVSKHSDIRVDEEDDVDCRRGRAEAQQMMSLLEKEDQTEIKELFLPHQGKAWRQLRQKNKNLLQPRGDDTEEDLARKQRDIMKIREQQHEYDTGEFIKLFIKKMNSSDTNKMFFLKWLKILLDEYTTAGLSALQQKYDEKWSTVLKLKENFDHEPEQLKAEQTELKRISEDLQAASFGLEHIMREISHIYESCSSVGKNKKDLEVHFYSLPDLAAEMMLSGFPLELMDGDVAHVPVVWISVVLDHLIQKLGDKKVFVLSVLELQGSGKSIMLNTMFGLQFASDASRYIRGAFMQLVKLSEEKKEQLKFDFILVIDTAGLRLRSTRHRDNELITFVVGLGNVTLINILGENPSELEDNLQTVVQTFMRMKKKKLSPSCVFVHQNISDVTDEGKNKERRKRLQENLDKITKHAAEKEIYTAEHFSDVIEFDVQNDVKYFAHLWERNAPMAPPNPEYCEHIQELKQTIFSHGEKSNGIMLTGLKQRIASPGTNTERMPLGD